MDTRVGVPSSYIIIDVSPCAAGAGFFCCGACVKTTEGGPMARPDKEAAIAALTEQFRSSGAVLLS